RDTARVLAGQKRQAPVRLAPRSKTEDSCAGTVARFCRNAVLHHLAEYRSTPPQGIVQLSGKFRRCCRLRSFHLAFWLLLSFARDALVHLNAIGRSVAAVSEHPDPPSREAQGGPGLGTTRTQLEGQRVVPERVIPQKRATAAGTGRRNTL